jgi:hypothetical protein
MTAFKRPPTLAGIIPQHGPIARNISQEIYSLPIVGYVVSCGLCVIV